MAPQHVQVTNATHGETPYEASGVKKAIVIRDFVDAESEEVDPWDEDQEDDPFGSDPAPISPPPAASDEEPLNSVKNGRPQITEDRPPRYGRRKR